MEYYDTCRYFQHLQMAVQEEIILVAQFLVVKHGSE